MKTILVFALAFVCWSSVAAENYLLSNVALYAERNLGAGDTKVQVQSENLGIDWSSSEISNGFSLWYDFTSVTPALQWFDNLLDLEAYLQNTLCRVESNRASVGLMVGGSILKMGTLSVAASTPKVIHFTVSKPNGEIALHQGQCSL